MQTSFQAADPAEMAEPVLVRLRGRVCRTLPVLRNGQLAGILNAFAAGVGAAGGRRASGILTIAARQSRQYGATDVSRQTCAAFPSLLQPPPERR